MSKLSCIYKIYSLSNPLKFYIGSAVDLTKRKSRHFKDLQKNVHANKILQNHHNKYGDGDLVLVVVEEVSIRENLIQREQFYIDELKPTMNISKTAGSILGLKYSEETRKKMSESVKKRIYSDDIIEKRNKLMIGNKYRQGLPTSKKQKEIVSKIMKGNKYALGRKRTDEFKKRVSEFHKGKKMSEKQRENLIKANTGRKISDENREKLRLSHLGKKLTKESIMKRTETRRLNGWNKRSLNNNNISDDKKLGELKPIGKVIADGLNKIDPNHVEKASDNNN